MSVSRHLKKLLKYQKLDILLLLESKVIGEVVARACAKTKFDKVHHIDGNDAKGGFGYSGTQT